MMRLPNPFYKIQEKRWERQAEKERKHFKNTYEFIWGNRSYEHMNGNEKLGFETENDISIAYNKKDKTYSLFVETNCYIPIGSNAERGYILSLFDEMTKWMQEQGYKTDTKPWIYNIFSNGYNINTEFKSIEELYTTFKCLVKGFCDNT